MSRTVLALLLLSATALSCIGCPSKAQNLPEPSMAESSSLHLSVVAPAAALHPGDEIAVTVRLQNDGAAPLWVNQRLLLNAGSAPAPFRELWVDVTGPDGQPRPFTCKVRAGFPEEKHYAVLPPGGKIEQSINLSRCYDFDQPGAYQISAHYQDGSEAPPAAPAGATHAGGVTTAAVALIVSS